VSKTVSFPTISGALSVLLLSSLTFLGCSSFKTNRAATDQSDQNEVTATESVMMGDGAGFPMVDSSQWSSMDTSKTGVVFAWSLVGSKKLVSDAGCRLRLRHRESGNTVLLKVDPSRPVSIQELKPGTWDAKRLGCGMTRVWDLQGLFRDGFTVKANSVSVVGWFVFEFNDRTLVTVREGGRQENSVLANQIRIGWSGTSTLISGFSGKPLPAQIEARDEVVRVKATGLANSDELLRPLLQRLQSCVSAGMKKDPLRAGRLKIEANYKAGKFAGAKTASAENALRDDLIQCLTQAHEAFNLSGQSDFKLDTTY